MEIGRSTAPNSAQYTYDPIGTLEKTLIAFHNSGHDVTFDSQWEEVPDQTYQFICKHLPADETPIRDHIGSS
jgi:esterase/lipase